MTAVITGTPTRIDTLTGASPGAQTITVPADAEGVAIFMTGINAGTALVASMTSDFSSAFTITQNGNTALNGVSVSLARVTSTGAGKTFTPSFNVAPDEGPCCSYAFVKGIPPSGAWFETVDVDQGSGSALTLSVTSATDSLVFFYDSDDSTIGNASGTTNLTNHTVNGDYANLNSVNSPGASTTSVTGVGTGFPASALVSIKASGGGSPTSFPPIRSQGTPFAPLTFF